MCHSRDIDSQFHYVRGGNHLVESIEINTCTCIYLIYHITVNIKKTHQITLKSQISSDKVKSEILSSVTQTFYEHSISNVIKKIGLK